MTAAGSTLKLYAFGGREVTEQSLDVQLDTRAYPSAYTASSRGLTLLLFGPTIVNQAAVERIGGFPEPVKRTNQHLRRLVVYVHLAPPSARRRAC